MQIKVLVEKIDEIINKMFSEDYNIYVKIKECLGAVNEVYKELIVMAPELNRIGLNIDVNIVLQQLTNVSEAIESRDKVQLFDALKFEILPTLNLYREIREIMEQE